MHPQQRAAGRHVGERQLVDVRQQRAAAAAAALAVPPRDRAALFFWWVVGVREEAWEREEEALGVFRLLSP